MIFSRNTVHSILTLILAFFSAASIWILLEAEFLAIILVLVYVGALMVMFLFVVMMLDINKSTLKAKCAKYLPLGLIVAIVLISELILVLGADQFGLEYFAAPIKHSADFSNITLLALDLYTQYVYPFELAAVLLLIAIIAAIRLTQRNEKRRKTQNINEQVEVKAKHRLRMVKIKVKKEGDNND
jgi:NADH-quinone oxidoreductase subunit J